MFLTIISFIFVHEFGHFISAKKFDIRVEEFSLGFGPKLISHKKGETLYSLRLFPLGGFCNLTGENIPDDSLDSMNKEKRNIYEQTLKNGRCFHQKSPLKKFLVIFMGPLMNFLLALFIFILFFSLIGVPAPNESSIIGEVISETPAQEAGLQAGDEIKKINSISVDNWEDMTEIIRNNHGEKIIIEYERNNTIHSTELVPVYDEDVGGGIIGIRASLIRERVGPITAIKSAVVEFGLVIYYTVAGFATIISERTAEGVGGPVMIASMTGEAARVGFYYLLHFIAVISINIGFINLLPIPALDGGRLLFISVEMIRGKPVAPEKEGFIHFIGFIILLFLIILIIYQDIIEIF